MHRIVGSEQQHCRSHYASGAQKIVKNCLFRSSGKQKVEAEKQHQRQRGTKGIVVYRVHWAFIYLRPLSYKKSTFSIKSWICSPVDTLPNASRSAGSSYLTLATISFFSASIFLSFIYSGLYFPLGISLKI